MHRKADLAIQEKIRLKFVFFSYGVLYMEKNQ